MLAKAPAPRIILFQGSLTAITMEPFGEFLIAMGYPEKQVRDPRDGKLKVIEAAPGAYARLRADET